MPIAAICLATSRLRSRVESGSARSSRRLSTRRCPMTLKRGDETLQCNVKDVSIGCGVCSQQLNGVSRILFFVATYHQRTMSSIDWRDAYQTEDGPVIMFSSEDSNNGTWSKTTYQQIMHKTELNAVACIRVKWTRSTPQKISQECLRSRIKKLKDRSD